MKEILEIFLTFFKVSSATFGGGMAMLPILQREIVVNKGWATDEEVIDYYALSQGLPGIVAVNVSCFLGYKKNGRAGEIAAAFGVIVPCIIIISILASFIKQSKEIEIVSNAFGGITIGVSAVIFNAIINLWKKGIVDRLCLSIFLFTFVLMFVLDLSPIIFVVIGAIVGIIAKKKTEVKS